MTALLRCFTVDVFREVLESAGCQVDVTPGATGAKGLDGVPVLTSAINGLGFELRLSNPLTAARKGMPAGDRAVLLPETSGADASHAAGGWADATFRTAFQVRGELPLTLVNAWNFNHRFARLLLAGLPEAPVLLLNMDVLALGGISRDNLSVHVEIWDRLMRELIGWLRVELPKLAKAAPVAEPLGSVAESTESASPADINPALTARPRQANGRQLGQADLGKLLQQDPPVLTELASSVIPLKK